MENHVFLEIQSRPGRLDKRHTLRCTVSTRHRIIHEWKIDTGVLNLRMFMNLPAPHPHGE